MMTAPDLPDRENARSSPARTSRQYGEGKDITCDPGGFCTLPGGSPAGDAPAESLLFLKDPFDRDYAADVAVDEDEEKKREQMLLCRACGHGVTAREQKREVQGRHEHTFFNPAGIVYNIGCFRNAPGCQAVGESSAEFSWFAGCVWRVALCRSCLIHLGWQFQSGDDLFYGLILSRLIEGEI